MLPNKEHINLLFLSTLDTFSMTAAYILTDVLVLFIMSIFVLI